MESRNITYNNIISEYKTKEEELAEIEWYSNYPYRYEYKTEEDYLNSISEYKSKRVYKYKTKEEEEELEERWRLAELAEIEMYSTYRYEQLRKKKIEQKKERKFHKNK